MVVQHNISAMNANRYFGINNSGLSKSLEKLSSGFSINRAGDNAAGLAVSEKMRAQISGLTQASKNAENGISMIQTFEGALQETDSILQRMRTLAVQSANGIYQNDVDREAIQLEYDQLNDELNQIADTDFNGVVVLNGGEMADGLKAVNGEFKYEANDRTSVEGLKVYNGEDADGNWSGKAAGAAKRDAKVDTINSYVGPAEDTTITYAYDGKGSWVNTYNGEAKKANASGGFSGVFGDTISVDTQALEAGDTITVKYSAYQPAKQIAPATADGTLELDDPDAPKLVVTGGNDSFKLNGDVAKDAGMSTTLRDALDSLDGATIAIKVAKDTGSNVAHQATANVAVTNVSAGSITGAKLTEGSAAVGKVGYVYDATKGTVDFYLNETGAAITDKAALANCTKLATATLATFGNTDAADEKTATYTLHVETGTYSAAVPGKVEVDTAYKLSGAETADLLEKVNSTGVSVSDSNDASTATMTYTDNITLQTGARTKDSVNFTFKYASRGLGELEADLDCSARGLGTDKLSLTTQEGANAAIDKIDNAINKVSMVRATFGAMQNRLEHKIANLNTNNENLTAAESRIRDTDMAKEMTNFTKNQILSQASQAMLAQANQLPQGVLQLLG